MAEEAIQEKGALEKNAMSPESVKRQVGLIQETMSEVMTKGEHFDTIPGTNKPILLQPGADKLNLVFRLSPEFHITESVRDKEFISYTVRCDLYHIPSDARVASGYGSCNCRESKYRYRFQNTGQQVPVSYWQNRDRQILGGAQYAPRKTNGIWYICEQVENDNPWDLDNTLLKMACKRAKIAATLNATAAYDIFVQDVEDMPRNNENSESRETRPMQGRPQQHTGQEPGRDSGDSQKDSREPTTKQLQMLNMQFEHLGMTDKPSKLAYVNDWLQERGYQQVESSKQIPRTVVSSLIDGVKEDVQRQEQRDGDSAVEQKDADPFAEEQDEETMA